MAKRNVVMKPQTLHVNLSPLGFHRYASEFLRAADLFECGDGFSPVPYYLRCRVIGLALKSFLLAKGFPKNDLKEKLGFSPVPYYLRCRVIELALKAFLLAKGFPKNDLKEKLGHNLENALNSATKHGLQSEVAIKPEEEEEIKKANVYYDADKGFEYFQVTKAVTGYPELPDLKILADVSSRLVTGLKDVCMKTA